MDLIGQILWFTMFVTPAIIIPLTWKRMKGVKKIFRVIIGLLIAVVISFVLYNISLAIIFRDGMGPT